MSDVDAASCLAEHASRGPRYTSYPPATEFGPLSRDQVQGELAIIGDRGEPVSLYVHVPFCKSLCWYCGCNVIATRNEARGVTYLDQLTTEMALLAGSVRGAPVSEIAIGGGSPNFLSSRSLRTMIAALERTFAIAPDARRSIELDPRTTSSAQVDALAAGKFRSLSMGVQLMCNGEVDLGRVASGHGLDAASYFAREIAAIDGMAELAGYDAVARTVRTTPRGRLLVRNVCMVFDRYHRAQGERPGRPAAAEAQPRFSSTI